MDELIELGGEENPFSILLMASKIESIFTVKLHFHGQAWWLT